MSQPVGTKKEHEKVEFVFLYMVLKMPKSSIFW